jgi:serine/threonine protein phosphatase PrpC
MGIQPAAGKNGQAPMLQVKTSSLTHPGQKRPNNEDYISSFKPDHPETLRASGRFFIVTDGVGGAAAGERASRYAAEKIKYEYYNLQDEQSSVGQRLTRSMQQANLDIYRYSHSGDRFLRMATTAVAAVIRGDELTVANVGDSRAYLIRDGQAQQITWDHTAAGEMIKSGIMTEEEAAQSRAQNRLTRSIGGAEKVTVDIFEGIRLLAGDNLRQYR